MEDILVQVSKRNLGALRVCFELCVALGELAAFDFALLEEMNVLGSDLWDLYKYCCNQDIDATHAAITQKIAPQLLQSVPGSTFYQAPQE